jgi:hypothetical protein
VDALELLNRSADFKYAADVRTTLMKLLSKQRQEFTERGATPFPANNRGRFSRVVFLPSACRQATARVELCKPFSWGALV